MRRTGEIRADIKPLRDKSRSLATNINSGKLAVYSVRVHRLLDCGMLMLVLLSDLNPPRLLGSINGRGIDKS